MTRLLPINPSFVPAARALIEDLESSPAHSSVGGSTVGRLLGCASSLSMIAAVPKALRRQASDYADEGLALHEIVAKLLADPTLMPESFFGKTITVEDRTTVTITVAHVRDCVLPILEFFNTDIADIEDYWLETLTCFPAVEGAFGTADFFGIGAKRSVLVDWKMGAGVGVTAIDPMHRRRNQPTASVLPVRPGRPFPRGAGRWPQP